MQVYSTQRSSAHAHQNDEPLSRPVEGDLFGDVVVSISSSRSRKGTQVGTGKSVAEDPSWLLIRLRRIVGSNPTRLRREPISHVCPLVPPGAFTRISSLIFGSSLYLLSERLN